MVISVVCNNRSEAGPLQSVIKALAGCVVTRFDSSGMSPAIAMSRALTFFTAMFTAQKATRVVVLGDRYETLAAALAAMFLNIEVDHIHGGEITTGAFDDGMRHSITHIVNSTKGLHFCATENAAYNVAQISPLGTLAEKRVFVTGAPGLDGVPGNSARRDSKRILCTYHPETRAEDYGLANCAAMLVALSKFPDYEVLFTSPNADPGAGEISELIDGYIHKQIGWRWVMMDHDSYVQAMQSAALVIGNSSAGVIEAPWINVPSINIGRRQNGREMAPSVYQTAPDVEFIKRNIEFALTDKRDKDLVWNPIYRGGAAEKIAQILLNHQEKAA